MNHANLLPNGKIQITVKSVAEAKLALKELKIQKKELQIKKKEIAEEIRCIRVEYTDVNLRRGSKMQGGGSLGRIVRLFQTASRDKHRYDLASEISPLEEQKQWTEAALISVDKAVLILEKYVSQNP